VTNVKSTDNRVSKYSYQPLYRLDNTSQSKISLKVK